jgi:hypothetical protein
MLPLIVDKTDLEERFTYMGCSYFRGNKEGAASQRADAGK